MGLSVTVLGSSAMYATAQRAASGYLVDIDGFKLWMDAGGGTWQRLLQYVDYTDLDGVLLSHRHPDHTIDVFQCFHARLYGGQTVEHIPLWAPQETLDHMTAFSPELSQAFDLKAIEIGAVLDIAGAKTSFYKMAHPPVTYGIRIEHDGCVLAYTADTGPAGDLHGLARDADVFICEATFQDTDQPWWEGHMSATQAGQAASDVGAKRLVLTHLPAERDLGLSLQEARAAAGSAEVELAEERPILEVGG
ncbi:MAG: MBL fold metallo-hydrolase [Actinomycetota bacterium]|nr:MBL fold metallo-hydrolase [Actinomycetota bacterium]